MSHFCVIVTNTLDGDSYDRQLAPFNEQDDEYMERMVQIEAKDVKAACLEVLRELTGYIDNADGSKKTHFAERLAEYQDLHDKGDYDSIIRNWYGYEKDDDGNYVSVYNPEAKWDWYEVGGRWSGYFKFKKNHKDTPHIGGHYSMNEDQIKKLVKQGRTDIATVGEIDWEAMRQEARDSAGKAYDKAKNPDEHFWGTKPLEDETRDQYIDRVASIAPFAVLDDGEWYENGSMGWWGVVSDENEDWDKEFEAILAKWLKEKPKMELTLIDCHI